MGFFGASTGWGARWMLALLSARLRGRRLVAQPHCIHEVRVMLVQLKTNVQAFSRAAVFAAREASSEVRTVWYWYYMNLRLVWLDVIVISGGKKCVNDGATVKGVGSSVSGWKVEEKRTKIELTSDQIYRILFLNFNVWSTSSVPFLLSNPNQRQLNTH